jgi:hypothetical protein
MANDDRMTPADPTADERLYTPAPNEAQLTARAIIVGCLVGSVISCTNIYVGLKIGWAFGASIIAAVLGFSVFAATGRRLTVLETNTAQTAGSAAGYMSSAAGLLAAIPAMNLLGYEIAWPMLILWSLAVAFLVLCYDLILGYTDLSFVRASSIFICHSTPRCVWLTCSCQAVDSARNLSMVPMRRPATHCRVKQLSSFSAMFSQLPCLGV